MPEVPIDNPTSSSAVYQCNIGMSVCRSVDQVLSAQYLLTPSLDQYQTWYRGSPQWVDDPYWFSGHMFRGHGQATLLTPVCCPLSIFWPLHLINTKLGAGVALNEKMVPIYFQDTCSKIKVKTTVLFAQYLLTPSIDQYQTWCRGCPQWVDDPYWFSGHMFKGQGQTTLLSPQWCPLNIFWSLHLINTKLGAGVALNK